MKDEKNEPKAKRKTRIARVIIGRPSRANYETPEPAKSFLQIAREMWDSTKLSGDGRR